MFWTLPAAPYLGMGGIIVDVTETVSAVILYVASQSPILEVPAQ